MRTKLTLLTMLLFFVAGSLWAQETTQRLVVWQKSGEKVYFDLSEKPVTRFSGDLLIIKTNTLETSYQRSNILRFTHEGINTAVGEIATHNLIVNQSKDGITLKNVPTGTPVKLYDSAGRLLETKTSDGKVTLQFSLAGRPAGVYFVNMNEQTFKISKR